MLTSQPCLWEFGKSVVATPWNGIHILQYALRAWLRITLVLLVENNDGDSDDDGEDDDDDGKDDDGEAGRL